MAESALSLATALVITLLARMMQNTQNSEAVIKVDSAKPSLARRSDDKGDFLARSRSNAHA